MALNGPFCLGIHLLRYLVIQVVFTAVLADLSWHAFDDHNGVVTLEGDRRFSELRFSGPANDTFHDFLRVLKSSFQTSESGR
jgi:hypothetical protein